MSVAAVVTYRTADDARADDLPSYLPLATEATFRRTWVPIAEDAGLELLPGLADGRVVEATELRALADELSTFVAAAEHAAIDGSERDAVLDRATRLIALLDALAADPDRVEELYIG